MRKANPSSCALCQNIERNQQQAAQDLSSIYDLAPFFGKYLLTQSGFHLRLRTMTEQSALLLRKQLAELNKNPVEGFSAGLIDDDDIYKWEVVIIGPQDTLFEGGFFKAYLTFPYDYPLRPPKMKFITEIWHPNVAKNGDVCISILHEPGEDKFGYEKPEERWLPIHTVETIMISVISMLADPNSDSPANVDAAKEWREDPNGEFKRKVARCVRKSQEMAFD
ncbi:ubiquitin-conjugating enzyme E2 G1-like isoform 1-T2 [Spinachia spinachia]